MNIFDIIIKNEYEKFKAKTYQISFEQITKIMRWEVARSRCLFWSIFLWNLALSAIVVGMLLRR